MAALLTCPCICSRLAVEDTGAENQSTNSTTDQAETRTVNKLYYITLTYSKTFFPRTLTD